MAGLGEVDANLVAAAGLQADLHQRRIGQLLDDAEVRDRELANFFILGRKTVQVLVGRQQRLEGALPPHG